MKKKMNLRSSGVRCNPDFHTLGLGLMIKRTRTKHSTDTSETQTPEKAEGVGNEKSKNNTEAPAASPPVQKRTRTRSYAKESPSGVIKSENAKVVDNEPIKAKSEDEAPVPSPQEEDVKNEAESSEKIEETREEAKEDEKEASEPPSVPLEAEKESENVSPPTRLRGRKSRRFRPYQPKPSEKKSTPVKPDPVPEERPCDKPNVYYFESDHVALKHNEDYFKLLSTVSILESQRQQCLKDIETLENKKKEASSEPIKFVEKLQNGGFNDVPQQQTVCDLPEISWSKYSSAYGTFDHVFSVDTTPNKPVTRKVKSKCWSSLAVRPQNSRSENFRVAWTVDEQRKLQELLQKYPSEEIEFNRYRKIAAELGNRTALQVQSRCQKYFIKLAKAGLPVPGNMPRTTRYKDMGSVNRIRRAKSHPQQHLTKVSTFFPSFDCPVRMKNDDDDENLISSDAWLIEHDQMVSDEEDVDEEMRFSNEYLEILRLKRIRQERLDALEKAGKEALAQHTDFRCDMCDCGPVPCSQTHCTDSDHGDDLCHSCFQRQFEKNGQQIDHFVDEDYILRHSRPGDYNYLDPNFIPGAH